MSGGTHCVILNEGREFTVGPGGNTVSYSSPAGAQPIEWTVSCAGSRDPSADSDRFAPATLLLSYVVQRFPEPERRRRIHEN